MVIIFHQEAWIESSIITDKKLTLLRQLSKLPHIQWFIICLQNFDQKNLDKGRWSNILWCLITRGKGCVLPKLSLKCTKSLTPTLEYGPKQATPTERPRIPLGCQKASAFLKSPKDITLKRKALGTVSFNTRWTVSKKLFLWTCN